VRLGLVDLVAPEFLTGVDLGPTFHAIVSFLRVSELESAWDDTGVVYSGKAAFSGEGSASPVPQHSTPSGAFFDWKDITILFRLTIPRSGASDIKSLIDTLANAAGSGSALDQLRQVLDDLGPVGNQNSDYPGFRFRLELMVTRVGFHLPTDSFLPAKLSATDGWLERDPEFPDVEIQLAKLAFIVIKGDSLTGVDADFEGWGANGLDDPVNQAAGEAFAMVPPLALSKSEHWGFGIEKLVLDFSGDFTPPEILSQFGTGDDFRGAWCPDIRFFHASKKGEGLAFDVHAHDLLIDFKNGISGEVAVDIMKRNTAFKVVPVFFANGKQVSEQQGHKVDAPADKPHFTFIRDSQAKLTTGAELQLAITGGEPPYTITVTQDDASVPAQEFNNKPNLLSWPLSSTEGESNLHVTVADNSAQKFGWDEEIKLTITAPEQKTETTYPTPDFTLGSGTEGYNLRLAGTQADSNSVVLIGDPANVQSATVSGSSLAISASGEITVPVTPGGPSVSVTATWQPPAVEPQPPIDTFFEFDVPYKTRDIDAEVTRIVNDDEANPQHPLRSLIQRAGGGKVHINGRASFNNDPGSDSVAHNITVSKNRATALTNAMTKIAQTNGLSVSFDTPSANGFSEAEAQGAVNDHSFEDAVATLVPPTVAPPPPTRQVTVGRKPPETHPVEIPTVRAPAPTEPARAPFFHRISFRVRVERNFPVLGEISGEVDFLTVDEQNTDTIRSATGVTDSAGDTIIMSPAATSQQPPPGDGTTDYRLTVSYDRATGRLTEEFVLGAAESDTNGLVHTSLNDGTRRIRNIEGALMIFAPLLAASVDTAVSLDGDDPPVAVGIAAGEIAIAATLGGSGVLRTMQLFLFGVDAKATERVGGSQQVDLNLLVDYGVAFSISLNAGPLAINSDPQKPFKVRYRGMGIRAAFGGGDTSFRPVFDTSKGYEVGLGDPGSLLISPPFDKLLTILAARVARTNPLTIECDLGMKVNLGVITVDRVRITALFRDPDPPSITLLPTGVSVKIPATLAGSGLLDLRNGIRGSLDLTIIPAKLRVQAALALQPITSGARSVTGVLAMLGVEFPNPIPLFGTGLGLYGLLGLFAMHFKRNENLSAQVPALDWLSNVAHGDPTDITAWVPEIDRWNFGVGAVTGTLDGGTVFNMKGMLLVELPGPRILIFVKAQLLTKKPDTKGPVESLGILGVVDLNLELAKITIGIALNQEIKDLIKLKVPVEALFTFSDISKWHLNIGSIEAPASADILGIYEAKGYLMFAGDEIANFPTPLGTITIPGLAIALGIRAALVLGDEDSGLFLKVSAALDASLVFSPFHVHGALLLEGELRLFIVSISASASLEVDAPSPTFVRGQACGEVDFFFFSVEGCVHVEIGHKGDPLPPPELVTGMSLQSRSPALVDGQGTDAPVDGSLGDAKPVTVVGTSHDADLLVVPIDAVPVLQMHAAPVQASGFTTFTLPLDQAPRSLPGGWIDQGGGRSVRYQLRSLEIAPPLPPPDPAIGLPKATWQAFTSSPKGADTSVALAMFSFEADPTPRAVVRSTDLTTRVGGRWAGACDAAAPAAPVLWTFNRQPLGPSRAGWFMVGIAFPDPPDVRRSVPVDIALRVHGPNPPSLSELLEQLSAAAGQPQLEPAQVIGDDPLQAGLPTAAAPQSTGRVLQLPFQHPSVTAGLQLPAGFEQLRDPEPERVIIESGEVDTAILLLAVTKKLASSSLVLLRAFDQKNVLLREDAVNSLSPKSIVNLTDLPPEWIAPGGPWTTDVVAVMNFLRGREPQLSRLLVTYHPPAGTVRFEVDVRKRPVGELPPAVLVGAIELLRTSEKNRQTHDEAAQSSDINTIEGALDAGRLRPLLQPDTRYTISLSYTADIREPDEDGNIQESDGELQVQRFTFLTANAPPARLDPWILATTPDSDQPLHFADDQVQVVFNDSSAVQLFEAYGKQLRAVVRKANGNHPPDEPPLNAGALTAVRGAILTPYEDTLRQVIASSELACIHIPPSESHQVFTVPVPLDRATAYTLEIQTQDPPPPGIGPRVPLFRISFTTSRFRTSAELAGQVQTALPVHRVLRAPVAPLSDVTTDKDLEDALMAAGLDALPPPTQPGFTYLWQTAPAGFTLAAVLIDSPEPLWRLRPEPALITDPSDAGDIQHWALAPTMWLEIVENGTSSVAQFVRPPGGARTLMILKPGATDANLVLRQHALGVLQATPAFTDNPIRSGALPLFPPWVEQG
jgi:large repetitive protein